MNPLPNPRSNPSVEPMIITTPKAKETAAISGIGSCGFDFIAGGFMRRRNRLRDGGVSSTHIAAAISAAMSAFIAVAPPIALSVETRAAQEPTT